MSIRCTSAPQDQPTEVPNTSCRKGLVVHLVNAMGMQVPVRVKLSTRAASDAGAMCHVVQVRRNFNTSLSSP